MEQVKPGIRVFLIDPQRLFRAGLKRILSVEQNIHVVGEAAKPGPALGLIAKIRPHVVLLESGAAGKEVNKIVRRVRQVAPQVRVVLMESSRKLSRDDFEADDVISKTAGVRSMLSKLRRLMGDNAPVGRAGGMRAKFRRSRQEIQPAPRETLTPRELEMLACIVDGLGNRKIAQRLSIREQTVKNYLIKIFDKLGVSDRLELALYVIHHRLVPLAFV